MFDTVGATIDNAAVKLGFIEDVFSNNCGTNSSISLSASLVVSHQLTESSLAVAQINEAQQPDKEEANRTKTLSTCLRHFCPVVGSC